MKIKIFLLLVLLAIPLILYAKRMEQIPPITMEYLPIIQIATTTATTTPPVRSNLGLEKRIRTELAQYPELIDIARCESRFRQWDENGKVLRGKINRKDVGIFQINELYHLKKSLRLKLNIHTVEGNIAYAVHLYKKEGVTPWGASGHCQNN